MCFITGKYRKPAVYLLMILPILIGGGILVIAATTSVYSMLSGIPTSAVPEMNGILIALPMFFLWIPISLILANLVLFTFPPLRRIAERFATSSERPNYYHSQRQLMKLTVVMAIICLPITALGFIL